MPGYEILAELGRGGMGVVYQARQTALGRLVALKMILAGAHADAADLARFKNEAQAIARLAHPNIVQVHEIGDHDALPYFSLEFCPGGSLDRKLNGTPLPPLEAAELVETLARAVHAAHLKGVIHRDLKPANVLLAEDGTPKVTDFGFARKLDEAGPTATGAVMGTPSYMPPEQAEGRSEAIGPAADVYALGAILYECLTGRPPFKAATALETILQVVNDDPVPPSQWNARLPRDLETICLQCLRKEAGKRYGSAEALAEDLRRFGAGEPVTARPVGRWERGMKWMRRNPAVAGLLAAVLLVLAVGTTVSLLFALEARRKADDLAAEKDRSDANARRAEEKEQEATRALEEVETTLIDSLLRPVGQPAPRWNDQGQNETPLDPSEIEALARLGSLSGDRLRLRFLDVGLQTPQAAERLGRRAEWVVQAVVGLDARRRRAAEELLAARLRPGAATEDVQLTCVRLGNALEVRDADFNAAAADALLAAVNRNLDKDRALSALSRGLDAVSGRLDATGAGKAADAIINAMARASDPIFLSILSERLAAVCGRLSTPDLLAVMQHPLAAGPAQRTLLDVLGRRTRRQFRSPWHFLDWAAANGVDLVPPGRTTPGEGPR